MRLTTHTRKVTQVLRACDDLKMRRDSQANGGTRSRPSLTRDSRCLQCMNSGEREKKRGVWMGRESEIPASGHPIEGSILFQEQM